MDKEAVAKLIGAAQDDVEFAKKLSDQIVLEQTAELDAIMRSVQDTVVNQDNPDDPTIESCLLQLTNALYFINARCEYFGFYDDVTKANARMKYNEEYAKYQMEAINAGKKPTQADCQREAETNSVDESMLNAIYSRSVKVIRGKLDSAQEMVRTLSKLLSVHMNSANALKAAGRYSE